MEKIECLIIAKGSFTNDPNLQIGSRGARKILVTKIYEPKEKHCEDPLWLPPIGDIKCPVQEMLDTEVAIFNHYAEQDRHYHKIATEMYMLLEGKMSIEVENKVYDLLPGDMIVVNPESFHKVLSGSEFLCRVVTVNCHGLSDKYIEKDPH